MEREREVSTDTYLLVKEPYLVRFNLPTFGFAIALSCSAQLSADATAHDQASGHCGEMSKLARPHVQLHEKVDDGVPEMHSFGPNGTVPELCEASGLSARGGVDSSAGICALEEGSEGAEDAGAGAERHDGELCPGLSRSAIRVGAGIGASRARSRPERVSCARAVAMSGSSMR